MLLSSTSACTTLLQQAQIPLGFFSLYSTVRHSLFLSSQSTGVCGEVVVATDSVKRGVVSLRDCVQGSHRSPCCPQVCHDGTDLETKASSPCVPRLGKQANLLKSNPSGLSFCSPVLNCLLSCSWLHGKRSLWCAHKLRLASGKEAEGLTLLGQAQRALVQCTVPATSHPRAQPAQRKPERVLG